MAWLRLFSDILRELHLSRVELDNVFQALNNILGYRGTIPRIDRQRSLSRTGEQDDPTDVVLAGEKAQPQAGDRLQPKAQLIGPPVASAIST